MLLFVTLGLQCVYMIEVYSKPSENVELIMMSIIPFSNLSVQLLVVYLILTQGTDKQLKGKDLTVTERLDGGISLNLRDYN